MSTDDSDMIVAFRCIAGLEEKVGQLREQMRGVLDELDELRESAEAWKPVRGGVKEFVENSPSGDGVEYRDDG